jgi:hypothetical protein
VSFVCAHTGKWVPQHGQPLNCVKSEDKKDWVAYALAASLVGVVLLWLAVSCCCSRRSRVERAPKVLRQSLLGSAMMPDKLLAQVDAGARWNRAQQRPAEMAPAAVDEEEGGAAAVVGDAAATAPHRQPRGPVVPLQVMFTNEHVGELRPRGWCNGNHALGVGGFAKVSAESLCFRSPVWRHRGS